MTIMLQSSKAQDRTLGVWFQNIQQGSLKLPRFQRFEAWDRWRISSFLNTIVNNLPVGVTLVLEVAGVEKFESRYIASSAPDNGGTVTQHLLDGQQRLTAFWRAMHNNYERETFYIYLPQFDQNNKDPDAEFEVRCVPRWVNKNQMRMPRWSEDSAECFKRGLVPISLLRPGDISKEVDAWLDGATKPLQPLDSDSDALAKYKIYTSVREKIKSEITNLRERVTHFNMPYLSLPASTSKDVALQVFINMNTNSKPLSLYDIIVAEVESVAEKSLHKLVAELSATCPNVSRYEDVSELILSTSALLQDKLPNSRGMIEMDKLVLLKNWPKLENGLKRMATFLEGQRVFDGARLPTNAVLAVIAAAYEWIPVDGDHLAKGEKLLRRYLWSSFFTDRYENTAPSRAFADFKALKNLLKNSEFTEGDINAVPVLNRNDHALADVDSLLVAGWPKAAGIEARAILAVSIYFGAIDFADNQKATYENIQKREYHHIFPDALLAEAQIPSYLSLNCALITWKTNRIIGRQDPLEYLHERIQFSDEAEVRDRLKSHLVNFDLLSNARYANIQGEDFKQKIEADFRAFLRHRARLVVAAMTELACGNSPSLEKLWLSHSSKDSDKTSESI